jgi:hypothetical protein
MEKLHSVKKQTPNIIPIPKTNSTDILIQLLFLTAKYATFFAKRESQKLIGTIRDFDLQVLLFYFSFR